MNINSILFEVTPAILFSDFIIMAPVLFPSRLTSRVSSIK